MKTLKKQKNMLILLGCKWLGFKLKTALLQSK